jgi:dihydropyrimidinase
VTPSLSDRGLSAEISRRELIRAGITAVSSGAAARFLRGADGLASNGTTGTALLIRRGRLITAEKQWDADVRVLDGKIVEIARNLRTRDNERVIDASGLQVLPGGIDPHAHLLPSWVDDYLSGSKAALAGGITTIGCMASMQRGETILDALGRQSKLAREQSLADIFLHPILGTPSLEMKAQLPALRQNGHSDIKIFMTSLSFAANQEQWTDLIQEAGRLGLITMLHCEDAEALAEAAKNLTTAGQTSLRYYAESRPVSSEVKAVERAVAICEKSRAPVYIVHLSSQQALDVCVKARARGLPLCVESRPIYLYFTKESYLEPDGPLYVGQPPLREAGDIRALWAGLADGSIDTLGSDHAPWTREQKMDPALNINRLRPGVADLQTMLPVFYSEGVIKKRVSLERFVALTSTNAARLFGIYPQKGTIAVGSDADLTLWDPKGKRKLKTEDNLSRAGFSLHDGWEITGLPKTTIRRGEAVFEEGKILATPGSGQVLSTGPMQPLRQKT